MLARMMLAALQGAPTSGSEVAKAATPEVPSKLDKAKESLSSIDQIRSLEDAYERGGALVEVLQVYAMEFVPKAITAVIWLIVGLLLIKLVTMLVNRAFKLRNVDHSIRSFVGSLLQRLEGKKQQPKRQPRRQLLEESSGDTLFEIALTK